jgi:hypothetical protein
VCSKRAGWGRSGDSPIGHDSQHGPRDMGSMIVAGPHSCTREIGCDLTRRTKCGTQDTRPDTASVPHFNSASASGSLYRSPRIALRGLCVTDGSGVHTWGNTVELHPTVRIYRRTHAQAHTVETTHACRHTRTATHTHLLLVSHISYGGSESGRVDSWAVSYPGVPTVPS